MAVESFFWACCLATIYNLNIVEGLNLSKHCGEHVCEKYQLCAPQELVCYPCNKVCEKNSHNYNEKSCEENCQDYIHDFMMEYVRKCDLEKAINRLYILSIVTLILVLILVTAAGVLLLRRLQKYRKQFHARNLEKKKYQQKLNSVTYSVTSNNETMQKEDAPIRTISRSLRDAMPSTTTLTTQTESPTPTNKSICSGSTNTVKTIPLSLHPPCEDNTLDYAAYVNQGLSHSPINDKV